MVQPTLHRSNRYPEEKDLLPSSGQEEIDTLSSQFPSTESRAPNSALHCPTNNLPPLCRIVLIFHRLPDLLPLEDIEVGEARSASPKFSESGNDPVKTAEVVTVEMLEEKCLLKTVSASQRTEGKPAWTIRSRADKRSEIT
jgi:hypothetical protein